MKIVLKHYFSLVKFEHTIFAMPFALIGFFLGWYTTGQSFEWLTLLYIILCMIFARNAAMAFNRYADRNIDHKNPRTANREIPKGIIQPRSVLSFVILNSILFIATTFFINALTFYLSPIALLVILGYTIIKQYFIWGHFVLGLGLALAPTGAYIAVTGTFSELPLLFSGMVIFWVSGFDIIYALQDEEFDKQFALNSIPAKFGQKKAMRISTGLHILTAIIVILAGLKPVFGTLYWIGALVFTTLLFYQHLIIRPHVLHRINLAFFVSNSLASMIFALFTILNLISSF